MDTIGKARRGLDRGVLLAVGLALSVAPLAWGSAALGRIAARRATAEPESLRLTAAFVGAGASVNSPGSWCAGSEVAERRSVAATTSIHVLHRWTAEPARDSAATRPDSLIVPSDLPRPSPPALAHDVTPLASVPPTGPIREARPER